MSLHHLHLQPALWQAAKVGHIKLMRELIAKGANPFIPDKHGRNAISYAIIADPKAGSWLIDLLMATDQDKGSKE